MISSVLFVLAISASAADGPSLYSRQLVGFGGWPAGLVSDTRVQYRVPGKRSDSDLFQTTYYGVGGRFQASPAFIDIGPRISIAPIEIFDIEFQGGWTGYAGPFGPIPMSSLEGRIESARAELEGAEIAISKFEVSATPTLKLKVGPVIAYDGINAALVRATKPEGVTERFWREPYRDMVLAYSDWAFEHEGALLFEAMDGDERPRLIFGATARHRFSIVSQDSFTNVGPMVVVRPGTKKGIPTILGRGYFYVVDPERVGTAPNLQFAAIWSFDKELD